MEVKNVTKKITYFIVFLGFVNTIYSQKVKYLLFDKSKDTVVIDINKSKYYKIDENLFEISRFNEIDTIWFKKTFKIKFTSVQQLWKEGKKISDSILIGGIKKKRIKIVETNNQIFDKIYIFEKINSKKYKRTRVWWIDY